MFIVKVKKFGVDWYIPYEMAVDSARGGGGVRATLIFRNHGAD